MELKKLFPFLDKIDMEDPNTKLAVRLGVLAFIVLTAIVILNVRQARRQEAGGTAVPEDNPAQVMLGTPLGEDRDILGSTDMVQAQQIAEKQSRQTNFGERIFSDAIPTGESDLLSAPDDGGTRQAPPQAELSSPAEAAAASASPFGEVMKEVKGEQERQPSRQKEPESHPVSGGAQPAASAATSGDARAQLLAMGINPDTGEYMSEAEKAAAAETGGAQTQDGSQAAGQQGSDDSKKIRPQAVNRSSGGVSSLDDDYRGYEGVDNLSANTITVDQNEYHPFEVMFSNDAKISNGGRVTLRLLEDMMINGVRIPENSPLSGICTIDEQRLNITVNALKVGDRIYTLNLCAYDTDGLRGLYCPQSNLGRSLRNGGSQAGSILQSAFQRAMPGYAGQIVSAGASVIQASNGNVTISVSQGYRFFLIVDRKD